MVTGSAESAHALVGVGATDRAYSELKRRIMGAELVPNEHRLESELADELGMSRTPIREACMRLQADGLVEIVPRRGVRITPISASDLVQIYDLLATLEARAAELAASRALDDAELAPLSGAVEDMAAALEAGDLDAWAGADDRFHRALVACCANDHLAAVAVSYSDRVHRARLATLRLRSLPTDSVADHRALLEAIRRGDQSAAHDLHLEHRRRTAGDLVELLRFHRLSVL